MIDRQHRFRRGMIGIGVLACLSLTSLAANATVYETGDNGIKNWRIAVRSSATPKIVATNDADRGGKVIALRGTLKDAFQLGAGRNKWNDKDEQVIAWRLQTDERFAVYVIVHTSRGLRYLRYTDSASSKLLYKKKYIDHGLGASAKSGRWVTQVRDLQEDITMAEPGNRLLAVNGMLVRGNLLLDDIALHASVAAAEKATAELIVVAAAPAPGVAQTPGPGSTPTPTSTLKSIPTPTSTPAPTQVESPAVGAETPLVEEPPANTGGGTGSSKGEVLAFPDAEGGGRYALGGRGGRIVIVDTLADVVSSSDGRTSLREALETMKGPRTVVFDVGGTFDIGKKEIKMIGEDDSRVTVACQSAPKPGVLIRGNGIRIKRGAHDIVMRHCAIRNIDPGSPASDSSRTIGVIGTKGPTRNMIFDQMSLGWATDENFTVFLGPSATKNIGNFTLSRSIVAEGDADSSHNESGQLPQRYVHSMGPSCSSSSPRYRVVGCSIVGNLIANNARRNPQMWGTSGEVLNNVIYNWNETALDTRPHEPGRVDLHVRGNLFKSGPTTKAGKPAMRLIDIGGSASHFRVSDNRFVDGATRATRQLENVSVGSPDRSRNAASPIDLDCVGASRPERSAFDARQLAEYRNGTGQVGIGFGHVRDFRGHSASRHPAGHDTDHDGMADYWETVNGHNPNDGSDHAGDADGDGYTNVEEYLAEIGAC